MRKTNVQKFLWMLLMIFVPYDFCKTDSWGFLLVMSSKNWYSRRTQKQRQV